MGTGKKFIKLKPQRLTWRRGFLILAGFATGLSLSGCGNAGSKTPAASSLEWTQSRTDTARYAYLDPNDLSDSFLFGASVTKVEDFPSSSLNMVIRPLKVKLKLSGKGVAPVLQVLAQDSAKVLLSFATMSSGKTVEVDFGSAGNDLQLQNLLDTVGGKATAGAQTGIWVSQGAPIVLNVAQDNDTVVVDLQHSISQAVLKADGKTIDHVISDHPGKVVVRLFLKRQKALPKIGVQRTVADGKNLAIGYFGSSIASTDASSSIQRFALGDAEGAQDSVTFYLKDVPTAFQEVAKQAVLSWNLAFGKDLIKVADATDTMDVGDPRVNVIKWFDGLDKDVSWAGVAKMIVEPDTGLVMGGDLYVNGSTVENLYKGIVDFSQRLASTAAPGVTGTLGGVSFANALGEAPVVPYLTDLSKNYSDYMQGYYQETIAHEVGHVLGLRHNFRGTTVLESNESSSVMDYAPRSDRDHYKGPGSYDIAAIRWGYFGETPSHDLAFCTDEDIWTYYDCSQGDWGDPVAYATKGLTDGTKILASKAIAISDASFIASMGGILENALKIKKLSAQLPDGVRAQAVQDIDAAYTYLYNAVPDSALQGKDLATVSDNLQQLRTLAKTTEDKLRAAGHL